MKGDEKTVGESCVSAGSSVASGYAELDECSLLEYGRGTVPQIVS